MQNKNPYYLHEQNQLKEYNPQQGRFLQANQPNNRVNVNEEFAREDSNNIRNNGGYVPPNYPPIIYEAPQQVYQQPSYPPYQPQNPQYLAFPPAPQYPEPLFKQFQRSSKYSGQSMNLDHCPYCNEMTYSVTEEKMTWIGWFVCFLLFCFTVVLFWIPFCFSCCKERHIKCSKCCRTKFVVKNDC